MNDEVLTLLSERLLRAGNEDSARRNLRQGPPPPQNAACDQQRSRLVSPPR